MTSYFDRLVAECSGGGVLHLPLLALGENPWEQLVTAGVRWSHCDDDYYAHAFLPPGWRIVDGEDGSKDVLDAHGIARAYIVPDDDPTVFRLQLP